MQQKSTKRHYRVVVVFMNGLTRAVDVKAASREIAEARALKRCPTAIDIRRSDR